MNPILEVTGLTRRFKKRTILDSVDLRLEADQTACLLGTNGAGKSTLLRCLLALDRPNSGTVRIAGLDPFKRERQVRELVGYVPDHADADPWMTVPDFLRFLAPHYPNWSKSKAEHYAQELELPTDRTFNEMSRGEAGKALLVGALAFSPKLLVLDEAFARLAPLVREEVLEFFVREAPLEGGAALVATHDLEIASRLADRIWMLDDSKLQDHDPVQFPPDESTQSQLRSLYTTDDSEALAG